MSCPHRHLDAAYVLGSLVPAERLGFEQHLADCDECSRAVRELAGLPGLLARVDPEVLAHPPTTPPVPDTLLPSLVREVRRTRARRAWLTGGLAAAAAAVVTVGTLGLAGQLGHDGAVPGAQSPTASSAPASPPEAMVPVGQTEVGASVSFASVAWGTRLDLTCTYEPGTGWDAPEHAPTYSLLVRTSHGQWQQVATWRALPGRTMRLSAATAADRDDITSVEVRTASGVPILHLDA